MRKKSVQMRKKSVYMRNSGYFFVFSQIFGNFGLFSRFFSVFGLKNLVFLVRLIFNYGKSTANTEVFHDFYLFLDFFVFLDYYDSKQVQPRLDETIFIESSGCAN